MLQLILSIMSLAYLPQHDAIMKCGNDHGNPPPLYAVDGRLVSDDDSVLKSIVPADIHALEIVCMNPQDSTFNRSTGVPVISLWLKDGPAGRLEPTLQAIIAAQDEYYDKHRRYAGEIHQLEVPSYPPAFRVDLKAGESGWTAAITIDLFLATCFAFDGDVEALPSGVTARQPKCLNASELSPAG